MIRDRIEQPDPRWCDAARKFWRETLTTYVLEDRHCVELLRAACEQLHRADQCRQQVDQDGVTIRDRFQQLKEHPALAAERSAANSFRLLVRELALGTDDPPAEVRGPRAKGYAQ